MRLNNPHPWLKWMIPWALLWFMLGLLLGCSRVKIVMASGATATSTSCFWDKSMGYLHYTYDPNGIEEIMVESHESKVVDVLKEIIR